MYAVMGKILVVNLSNKEIKTEIVPEEIYYNFLSGKGLGAWYIYNNIPKGAEPLGEDNIIGFTSGALTGTGALMFGRWSVVTKSPLTGGWGDANCGGNFSPAIKQCGYDAIFFKGKSKSPVYLYCDNKGAEIRDASAYWGLDAVAAEDRLTLDNYKIKRPAVVVIGEAGEKMSRISGICNDGGRIAARSGVGAVMGSKKLKGIVLCGSKPIPVADFEAVKADSKVLAAKLKKANLPSILKSSSLALVGKLLAATNIGMPLDGMLFARFFKKWGTPMLTPLSATSGDGPVKNWGGSVKDFPKKAYSKLDADVVNRREIRKYHCYSCGMGCGGVYDISDLYGGEFKHTHKPEYETYQAFGGLILNDNAESIMYISALLNAAGMDSISAGNTVAFAIECFENGILTEKDTEGLQLKWSNIEDIIVLLKKMIKREGVGEIFADGVKVAAEKLGERSKPFAMEIGGSEPGMHDSRFDPQLAVHYVAEPAPGKHTIGMGLGYSTLGLSNYCSWAPKCKFHSKKTEYIPTKEEAMKSVANACYAMVLDGTGGCLFGSMFGVKNLNPAKYMNAAAGWDRSFDEYMECGRRIQTTRQLFNVKHGIDIASIKLPERMEGNPPLTEGPLKGLKLSNKEMVALHYEGLGWDNKTGEPTEKTLKELNLDKYLSGVDV